MHARGHRALIFMRNIFIGHNGSSDLRFTHLFKDIIKRLISHFQICLTALEHVVSHQARHNANRA